jgi:CheY-like chemotaxis protein
MTVRVLLVDDNAQFLAAAREFLEREGFAVAAVASSTSEALERVRDSQVDLALVDVDLGDENGFDLVERLTERFPPDQRPKAVLISTYEAEDLAELIEASPAVGFISKARLSGDAIRRVLGETS